MILVSFHKCSVLSMKDFVFEHPLQVFRWSGGSFVSHQTLPVRGVLSAALFARGGSVFLAISQANARPNALLLRWSGSEFINFQEVLISGTTQVEALASGDDIYLIFAKTVFLGKKIECL